MTLGEIHALNHFGIDMLDSGDYKQAAEVFAHSISLLSSCSLQPTPLVGSGSVWNNQEQQRFVSVYSFEEEAESSSASSDFYCYPFHFEFLQDAGQEDEPDLTSEQYNSCTITSLFNLGICFHLQWEEQKCQLCLLQKALLCYEQAISLTYRTPPSPSDPVLKVLMAVCANATHCNSELVNFDQMQRWNQTLKQIIKFSNDRHLAQTEHFFSMNAFFNSFGRTAAHAA